MEELNLIPGEIQIWIIEFLNGSIGNEEVVLLNQWISESDEHLKQFNALKTIWILSGKPIHVGSGKIEAALLKMKQVKEWNPVKPALHFWNGLRIAISWVILFMAGVTLSAYFIHRNYNYYSQQQNTTITAPLGSKSMVDLPDGSKVWLNAGSNITFNNKFGKSSREVTLIGEAYFDVSKNEKLPFLVKTKKYVTIKVLGTAFNVKAYPEENFVETTVERGKVQVSKLLPESEQICTVTLLPKQKLMMKLNHVSTIKNGNIRAGNSGSMESSKSLPGKMDVLDKNVETKIYTSWKDGLWIIESETLESIAVKIERNYNIKVEFKDVELKNYIFSGILKEETLEQVLELIKLSAPIKYHIDQRKVVLTKNRLIDNANQIKN